MAPIAQWPVTSITMATLTSSSRRSSTIGATQNGRLFSGWRTTANSGSSPTASPPGQRTLFQRPSPISTAMAGLTSSPAACTGFLRSTGREGSHSGETNNLLFPPAPVAILPNHAQQDHRPCPVSRLHSHHRRSPLRRSQADFVLHQIKRLRALRYFVEGRPAEPCRESPPQARRKEWMGIHVHQARRPAGREEQGNRFEVSGL